ncbi:MAG: hypothetical protein LC689_23265 [Myxococcales bacterium]|nr:hypothetical protein [Myxococcales bacterium]
MLASARVVASSFTEHHPGVPFFVLLADEVEGYFDPADEPYDVLFLRDLDIPDEPRFRFRLPQQPLSYAATPFLIAALLRLGYERVVFIKQESLVLGELASVAEALPSGAVGLTPHLLEPVVAADAEERELTILLAGVFNAGLVVVAAGEPSDRLLAWWQDRVYRDCRYAVVDGIHYEQRWLDLAPAYFENVHVLHDAGLNSGHWSLPDRDVAVVERAVWVDGRPCRLFRFSGYDAGHPEAATRYSSRLRTAELGDAGVVFERYREALLEAAWGETRAWPYAYERFSDGTAIPEVARDIYRRMEDVSRFGDPFDPAGDASLVTWLNEPADGRRPPSRFWFGVYEGRPDLQLAFPDVLGRHRRAFLRWTRSSGVREHGVPEGLR